MARHRRPVEQRRSLFAIGAIWLLPILAAAWALYVGTLAYLGSPTSLGWSFVWVNLRWLPTIATHVPRNTSAVIWVTLLTISMVFPGEVLLRLLHVEWRSRIERVALCIPVGLAAWLPLLLAVGWSWSLRPGAIGIATGLYVGIPLVICLREWIPRLRSREWRERLVADVRPRSALGIAFAVIGVVIGYIIMLGALVPETQYDARWYHLGSAAHYAQVGHFYDIVAVTHEPQFGLNPYAEIYYSAFYSWGGQHAAKVFAFMFLPLTCLMIIAFADVLLRSRRKGLLAAIIFMSVPIVSWSATTTNNDLPVALFTLLAVYLSLRWYDDTSQFNLAWLAVYLAGFTWGIKAFGVFTLVLIIAFIVVVSVVRRIQMRARTIVARFLLLIGAVGLACAPLWIRVWSLTGDPIFPVASKLFHSPYWNQLIVAHNPSLRHTSISDVPFGALGALVNMVTNPIPYRSVAGPIFIVALPLVVLAVACSRRLPGHWWTITGGFISLWYLGWYLGPFDTSRYLLDIAPLAALWIVEGLAVAAAHPRFGRALPAVSIAMVTIATLASFPFFVPLERGTASFATEGPIPYRWDYLYQHLPESQVMLDYIPMVDYMNAYLNTTTTKVFDGADLISNYMYLKPEIYNGSAFGSPKDMGQWTIYSPTAYQELRSNHITDVVVASTSVKKLRASTVWPHLHKIITSIDGYVLYQLVTS